MELHQGPAPFCPEACLPPSTINLLFTQTVCAQGTCRLVPSHPQQPLSLPPVLIRTQSPEGTRVAGGWHVSTPPSMHTPSQVMTAPELGLIFAPKSQWVPGAGKGQAVKAGISKPVGVRGASWVPNSAEMSRSTAAAGLLQPPPTWMWAGLLLIPGSCIPGSMQSWLRLPQGSQHHGSLLLDWPQLPSVIKVAASSSRFRCYQYLL